MSVLPHMSPMSVLSEMSGMSHLSGMSRLCEMSEMSDLYHMSDMSELSPTRTHPYTRGTIGTRDSLGGPGIGTGIGTRDREAVQGSDKNRPELSRKRPRVSKKRPRNGQKVARKRPENVQVVISLCSYGSLQCDAPS